MQVRLLSRAQLVWRFDAVEVLGDAPEGDEQANKRVLWLNGLGNRLQPGVRRFDSCQGLQVPVPAPPSNRVSRNG